ncbi:MAG: tetratricopeptide repeat protein [Spirochaetales bacterium]
MNTNNPLNSVIFISLTNDFSLGTSSTAFDSAIPLPVQTENPNIGDESEGFNLKTLTLEQILAGILTVLAYDHANEHTNYYRRLLLTLRPKIKEELTDSAILKTRNEDFDIAEEIFMALQGIDPDDTVNILNMALFFDQRADSYRQSNLTEDADAYDESAHRYYTLAMQAEALIPDAFFNAGFFYLKQKNFLRGRECFETYLSLTENLTEKQLGENATYKKERAKEIISDIDNRNLDDELFKSAFDFISMGQEEKGLEAIREFLEKNPTVWNAWFMLGWALRRLERWEDAKNALEQCLSCGGENTDTYNELAICLIELQDYKNAEQKLKKALAIECENTKIMSNMGYLALKQGDIEKARRYFETVLEFDPNDRIAKETLIQLEKKTM